MTFFSNQETQKIIQAIKSAETLTSGEIKVHIQKKLKHDTPLQEAKQVFYKLGMQNTKDQNAVLLLVSTEDHRLAVYADQGIYKRLDQSFWNSVVEKITTDFKALHYTQGLIKGIEMVGQALKDNFPYNPLDDVNEINDEISYA